MNDPNNKGGIEDDPTWKGKDCRHPEHNPPMHLHIPPGKRYRHVCPACGRTVVVHAPEVTLQ